MHTSFAEDEEMDDTREADELLRTFEDLAQRLWLLALSNSGRLSIKANGQRYVDARDRVSLTIDRAL